jgi:hypothetical protein
LHIKNYIAGFIAETRAKSFWYETQLQQGTK